MMNDKFWSPRMELDAISVGAIDLGGTSLGGADLRRVVVNFSRTLNSLCSDDSGKANTHDQCNVF